MKTTAFDKVTIDIDYPRPFFEFPDLSSPQGNPHEYFPMVSSALSKYGFSLESQEIKKFRFTKYEDHFNTIARYLDLKSNKNVIKEDEEFIYVKVKKQSSSLSQIPWFQTGNLEDIKSLVAEKFNFAEENTYGRTFFHYIKNDEILKYMLNENKSKQWINFVHFDKFEGQILHCQNNLKNYTLILNAVIDDYPDLASKLILIENKFGKTPYDHLLSLLNEKVSSFLDENNIEHIGGALKALNRSNPEQVTEIFSQFNKVPLFDKLSADEKKQKISEIFSIVYPDKPEKNFKKMKL